MGQGAASLRRMRVLQAVFLGITVLYAYAAELLAPTNGAKVPSSFLLGIVIAAIFVALTAYVIRRQKLYPALEKLRVNSDDYEALKSWRFMIMLSLIFAEMIALLGLVIRVMGGTRVVSWPFFLVALILMVIWGPRLSVNARSSTTKAAQ